MNGKALWIRLHREGFAVKPGDQPGSLSVTPRKKVGPDLESLIVRYKNDLLTIAATERADPIPIVRDREVVVSPPSGDREYRWTPLPSDVFTHWLGVLSHSELVILLHLCHAAYGPDRATHDVRYSLKDLGDRLGLSRRCLYDALSTLEGHGLLDKESVPGDRGRPTVRVRLAHRRSAEERLAT